MRNHINKRLLEDVESVIKLHVICTNCMQSNDGFSGRVRVGGGWGWHTSFLSENLSLSCIKLTKKGK